MKNKLINSIIVEFKNPKLKPNRTFIDVDMRLTSIESGFVKIAHFDEVGNGVIDWLNSDEVHAVRYVHYKETE